jgi:hypothetical protein
MREAAYRHLGEDRRRYTEWRREYHALLAAYGVYSVRFDYSPRERAAAFASAGVAAGHV